MKQLDAQVFTKRREQLLSMMDEKSMIVIFSGKQVMRSADEEYRFSVDRSFYYLTGIDRENMVLVLSNLGNNDKEMLFIEPYDELKAKWVGPRMKQDEATAISGVEEIYNIEELDACLHDDIVYYRDGMPVTLGLDLWKYNVDQADGLPQDFARRFMNRYPDMIIRDVYDLLVELRTIKSEEEIACMKVAQNTTRVAIEAMMSHAKPGMNECEMEGAFDFALAKQGVKEHAFPSIVAGGVRATILHYGENNQTVNDGEMVLLDLGSTHLHYCADISRTFPVNGKFSPRQKELYELVLEVQEKVIKSAKPGVTLKDLQQVVLEHYEANLEKLGLAKDGKTVRDYYWHGVSHHLGLDTHDITVRMDSVLRPGMVITVEPGIYVEEEAIGIRIEDDILITEDGAMNLSEGILKTVDEIEAFMAK